MNTVFETGDIVRFTSALSPRGLYEVTGYDNEGNTILLTSDQCYSEFYADPNELLLVCSKQNRADL